MQLDNIEYFAKPQQNSYVTECTHTLACGNEGVKQCTCTFRACSFTAWFSRLKCIKSDCKMQDMGKKMYLFTFYMIKITQRMIFFPKISTVTNVILILYNSSINNELISRDLHFRHHIACFCSISLTKNNSKQLQRCFASLSNMTVIRSWMNHSFKWFGSVTMTHLLTVTWCHLLTPAGDLISLLKSIFIL